MKSKKTSSISSISSLSSSTSSSTSDLLINYKEIITQNVEMAITEILNKTETDFETDFESANESIQSSKTVEKITKEEDLLDFTTKEEDLLDFMIKDDDFTTKDDDFITNNTSNKNKQNKTPLNENHFEQNNTIQISFADNILDRFKIINIKFNKPRIK